MSKNEVKNVEVLDLSGLVPDPKKQPRSKAGDEGLINSLVRSMADLTVSFPVYITGNDKVGRNLFSSCVRLTGTSPAGFVISIVVDSGSIASVGSGDNYLSSWTDSRSTDFSNTINAKVTAVQRSLWTVTRDRFLRKAGFSLNQPLDGMIDSMFNGSDQV